MRFLIYVNDTPPAEQAVQFGGRLAAAARAGVTLLASAGSPAVEPRMRAALERAQRLLPRPAEISLRLGRATRVLLAEAQAGTHDLLVAGSRGLRGWHRLALGSLAARLARYSPISVLIVKGPPRPGLRRVLACTGGGVHGEQVARWAGRISAWMGAELTVLHVMSQLALSPTAPMHQLTETAEEAMAEQTREGQHLAHELELVRDLATPQAPLAKLRHGLVVDEIAAEAREGDYDLVVIGGHQAPGAHDILSQIKAYVLEDVADRIVTALDRPVLVVKGT